MAGENGASVKDFGARYGFTGWEKEGSAVVFSGGQGEDYRMTIAESESDPGEVLLVRDYRSDGSGTKDAGTLLGFVMKQEDGRWVITDMRDY